MTSKIPRSLENDPERTSGRVSAVAATGSVTSGGAQRPPTLEMVAARAGVGRQTVSYAINSPQRVAPQTLVRVMAAIDELGYRPNRVARSLRTQSTRMIGYHLQPSSAGTNPVLDRFVSALAETARDEGYHVLLCAADDEADELAAYTELIQANVVDAFVLSEPRYRDPRPLWLAQRGVPSVSFGRIWGQTESTPWVDVDGAGGTADAVAHLAGNGHRNIGFLGPPRDRATADDRFRGWRDAMRRHRLGTVGRYVRGSDSTVEQARRAAARLLGAPDPPTAVVAANDLLAVACYHEADIRGLTVGTDLCVVGFDDSLAATILRPGLSSVSQPLEQVGHEIIRLVARLLSGAPPRDSQVLLAPKLVVRESSSTPRPVE